jgi:hypothetical protein
MTLKYREGSVRTLIPTRIKRGTKMMTQWTWTQILLGQKLAKILQLPLLRQFKLYQRLPMFKTIKRTMMTTCP